MSLSLIFDIVVVAIFVICIISASKKGLVKASYGIISIILTITLMFVFQDSITEWVKNSPFGENIEKRIEEHLNERIASDEEKEEIKKPLTLPEFLENIISKKDEAVETAKEEMVKEVSDGITNSVINISSIVILYFAIKLALFLLLKVVDAVFRLPILKTVNKFGGILLGAVNALFIIYILCALLIWLIPQDNTKMITDAINETYITGYFYNENLLLEFLMK